MIKINLLPGGEKKKRAAGGGLSLKLPGSLATFDRITAFTVAAWIIGLAAIAWLFFSVEWQKRDAQVALDQAVADSARYARLIETQQSLQARRDTIAQKLAIIQEIDAGRYIWPHLMDEISQALPPYTWLDALEQTGANTAAPEFIIEGRTGSLPALTRFMDALEASPFIRNVQLISSEQVQLQGGAGRVANSFALTGVYEQPPMEAIETVPLFEGVDGDEDGDVAGEAAPQNEEADDGTGTS